MVKPTILLVDYDPTSIESTLGSLADAGYQVEVATDGAAGLDAFGRLKPDLVLLQMMLPKKTGLDLCREIRRSHPPGRPPILMFGTGAADRYRPQAVACGADGYLPGPIEPGTLVEICNEYLMGGRVDVPDGVQPWDFLDGLFSDEVPTQGEKSVDPSAEEITRQLDTLLPSTPGRPVEQSGARPAPATPPRAPEKAHSQPAVRVRAQQVSKSPLVREDRGATWMAPRPSRLWKLLAGFVGLVGVLAAILVARFRGPHVLPPSDPPPVFRKAPFEALASVAEAPDERPPRAAAARVEANAAGDPVGRPREAPRAKPPARVERAGSPPRSVSTKAAPVVKAESVAPAPVRIPPASEAVASADSAHVEPTIDPQAPGSPADVVARDAVEDDPAPPPPSPTPSVAAGDLVDLLEVDTPPLAKSRASPSYPEAARRMRREAKVPLRLLVDENGEVAEAVATDSSVSSDFVAAAIRAARAWTYSPATKNGVPVKVWVTVQITFKL